MTPSILCDLLKCHHFTFCTGSTVRSAQVKELVALLKMFPVISMQSHIIAHCISLRNIKVVCLLRYCTISTEVIAFLSAFGYAERERTVQHESYCCPNKNHTDLFYDLEQHQGIDEKASFFPHSEPF